MINEIIPLQLCSYGITLVDFTFHEGKDDVGTFTEVWLAYIVHALQIQIKNGKCHKKGKDLEFYGKIRENLLGEIISKLAFNGGQ